MAEPARADWFTIFVHGLFVLVGGVLVFGFFWSLAPAVERQQKAPCRELAPEDRSGPAPAFTVQDLDGNPVSLSDFSGKFVVLNFWATWCEPCVTEWPELHMLAERLAEHDDIVVLAVSVDEDRKSIREFLDGLNLGETRVRVLWDPDKALNETYGSPKLPDTYFIDRDGQLRSVFVNVRDWGSPVAAHCTEAAAAGS